MIIRNLLLTIFLLEVSLCNGARILAIFPFHLKSHFVVLEAVVEELANKGHTVDVISSLPVCKSTPNCTNILTFPAKNVPKGIEYKRGNSPLDDFPWLLKVNSDVCELLGHPVLSRLIKNPPKDPPYDLLIVHLLIGYQCLSAIGIKWNIPLVGVVTTIPYPQMHHFINNPLNLAVMLRHYRSYEDKLGFWDRVYNVILTHQYIYYYYKDAGIQDYYIKKYLGADMPSYSEIEKSYALILSNSHYLYHGVKPQAPALIEIGGINVKPMDNSSEWDPKLKKIVDESKDGFVYFSFGSLFIIESLDPGVLEKFYAAIRTIAPVNVILKSLNPKALPKNLPSNVFTFPWLPQQKLLQHPNIKAFITHGGNGGMQEAIYYKVPMICVPFFAEQHVNCDISRIRNISIKLDIRTAKQEDYDYAFQQILTNPFWKRSIEKFSALYWQRPQSPREAVSYWIDYVLRHGKNVLRTQGLELKWWQVELLDVYVFLLACSLTALFAVIFVVVRLFKYLLPLLKLNEISRSSKKLN